MNQPALALTTPSSLAQMTAATTEEEGQFTDSDQPGHQGITANHGRNKRELLDGVAEFTDSDAIEEILNTVAGNEIIVGLLIR